MNLFCKESKSNKKYFSFIFTFFFREGGGGGERVGG